MVALHHLGPWIVARPRASAPGRRVAKDVDVEVLARAVHCFHVGYFLTRYVFAPDVKWDDKEQIELMADILEHGVGAAARRNSGQR
jgi:hypothetical protein